MIKFTSVSKYFSPEAYAVDNLTFEIKPGEMVLLTGPSGSGKTTIMRLLTREYTATSGEIFFADKNLNELKKSEVHQHKRKIGVIFQDYKLLPELNIWENIALPLSIIGKKQEEIESRVTDLLTLVSLTEKAYLFPKQLSGGEAQRISIARALSTGPAIIFADEPTGNLDLETSLEIGRLLKKINSFGTTLILATHDQGIIGLFNEARNITLEKGKLKKDTGSKKTEKVKKVNSESKEAGLGHGETKEGTQGLKVKKDVKKDNLEEKHEAKEEKNDAKQNKSDIKVEKHDDKEEKEKTKTNDKQKIDSKKPKTKS